MADGRQVIQDQKVLVHDRCLIGGVWEVADEGLTLPVENPATGDVLAEVPLMGAVETRRAINAARAAFPLWSSLLADERADFLFRWYELIQEHAEGLAHLLTAEQGKPLQEARGEIRYAASFVRFFAEEARRVYGETIPAHRNDNRVVVMREPIGVVACITPWNFPAAMITRKAAPALAAGCTVVMKPAEATPLSALALAGLAEQAGALPGVLNILTGIPNDIGVELCANPDVRKMSFTGSTAVGRLLAERCAPTVKRLSLELGGNAPFIVFEDANLDAAVAGAILCKFRHSGQTCICANRFLIHSSVVAEFTVRLLAKVKLLKLGCGFDPDVDVGPLINEAAIAKVEAHIADALAKGASLLVGAASHKIGTRFFPPTVLSGITPQMRMAREETFGPVAGLMTFQEEAEAIQLANDTEFGLAGYFYSRDISRAWRVARRLECGMVGINTGFLSIETAPFGGVKQSGFGREGSHHGISEFLQLKYMNFGVVS